MIRSVHFGYRVNYPISHPDAIKKVSYKGNQRLDLNRQAQQSMIN